MLLCQIFAYEKIPKTYTKTINLKYQLKRET